MQLITSQILTALYMLGRAQGVQAQMQEQAEKYGGTLDYKRECVYYIPLHSMELALGDILLIDHELYRVVKEGPAVMAANSKRIHVDLEKQDALIVLPMREMWWGEKVIALPLDDSQCWMDGNTGKVGVYVGTEMKSRYPYVVDFGEQVDVFRYVAPMRVVK